MEAKLVERVRGIVSAHESLESDITATSAKRNALSQRISEVRGLLFELSDEFENSRDQVDLLYAKRRDVAAQIRAIVPAAELAPEPESESDAEVFLKLSQIVGTLRQREGGSGYSVSTRSAGRVASV